MHRPALGLAWQMVGGWGPLHAFTAEPSLCMHRQYSRSPLHEPDLEGGVRAGEEGILPVHAEGFYGPDYYR
jgi:hypothetical protein